jgi:hypothetical protein
MKRSLLLLALLMSSQLSATHLQGGEITWKCQSNGKYQFTLVLYRDCASSVSLPTSTMPLSTNAGVNINCAFIGISDIVSSSYLGIDSCAGATNGTGIMQKYVYRSGDITLTGTPPASGWYFTWSSCCRSAIISNIASPGGQGYQLRSVMYPYTPPGATVALSAGTSSNPTCYDSSPNFLEDPFLRAPTAVDITYNSYGFDPDFDSIYFSFAPPLASGTSAVLWATGYSTSSPLPSGAGSTAANMSTTGELTFNSAISGNYAMCIGVEGWRSSQLVGAIYRDISLAIISNTVAAGSCASAYISSPPDVSITPLKVNSSFTPIANVNGDTTSYIINARVGDTISLNLSAADAYPLPNCSSQDITFIALGTDSTQITSLNPGGVFTYPGSNQVSFNWIIDSADYYVGSGYNDSIPYDYYFTFKDDEAPVNRVNIKRVRINVGWPASFFDPKYCLISGDTIQMGFPAGSYSSYLWSTGDTTNSIDVSQSGYYSVIVQNAVGQTDTLNTIVSANPTPIIQYPAKLCSGQTTILTVQNNHTSYQWGGDTSGTSNSITTGVGTYWLTVSDSLGCIGADTIIIEERIPYTDTPRVCVVTNDPVTSYNQIIWERPSKLGTVSYNIYRESVIGYTNIGSRGVNQLSEFTDSSSNPGQQAHKYYITLVDSCGNEYGSSSTEHSTIHLQSGIGTIGEVNLVWTSYSGATPSYYKIFRKPASATTFIAFDSVNVANNTYTDFNPPTGSTEYQVAAVMGSGCNSSSKKGLTSSLSNTSNPNAVSIKEDAIGSIDLSPNPNTGYFSITVDQQLVGSVYRIIDNLGRLIDKGVITEQTQAFDLSDKPKGIYRIQVSNEYMVKTLSVVIQ